VRRWFGVHAGPLLFVVGRFLERARDVPVSRRWSAAEAAERIAAELLAGSEYLTPAGARNLAVWAVHEKRGVVPGADRRRRWWRAGLLAGASAAAAGGALRAWRANTTNR
jgi:hypothetical protein